MQVAQSRPVTQQQAAATRDRAVAREALPAEAQAETLADLRPAAAAQRQLADTAAHNPRGRAQQALHDGIQNSARGVAQRQRLQALSGGGALRSPAQPGAEMPVAQAKRVPPADEAINQAHMALAEKTSAEIPLYAEQEYLKNLARGRGLMDQVRAAATAQAEQAADGDGGGDLIHDPVPEPDLPSAEFWDIKPASAQGQTIRGFGMAIDFTHKTLKADGHPVGYGSNIRREQGQLEVKARANYAANAGTWLGIDAQDPVRTDPFVQLKLNEVWARQMAYFRFIEALEGTTFAGNAARGEGGTVSKVTRSRIENPSTLFTFWLTSSYPEGGEVADAEDRMALLGSPNGWSIMYMLKDHPDMLAGVDPEGDLLRVDVEAGAVTDMVQTLLRPD